MKRRTFNTAGKTVPAMGLIITLRNALSAGIEKGGWGRAQRTPRTQRPGGSLLVPRSLTPATLLLAPHKVTINAAAIALVWWLTAGAALAAPTAESRTRHPNILFIITDQQFAEAMSCAGNPYVKTPAIDSLAERGMVFTEAYATSPVCSPSRGSMLTGLFPHQHGVHENGRRIKADFAIFDRGEHQEQLHDMQNDRGEMRNLAADPKYRDVLTDRRRRLAAWCNKTEDTGFIPHLVSP